MILDLAEKKYKELLQKYYETIFEGTRFQVLDFKKIVNFQYTTVKIVYSYYMMIFLGWLFNLLLPLYIDSSRITNILLTLLLLKNWGSYKKNNKFLKPIPLENKQRRVKSKK